MSTGILPKFPRTRKLPKSVEKKIGRRNGRNENGPKYFPKPTDVAAMHTDGYVRTAAGWLRREYLSPSQLAELDARDASDNGSSDTTRDNNAERIERLRLMAEELEANSHDRCPYCRAPDGQCSH